jgi:uncharacterized membrane protein YhaH (DUF805 family)
MERKAPLAGNSGPSPPMATQKDWRLKGCFRVYWLDAKSRLSSSSGVAAGQMDHVTLPPRRKFGKEWRTEMDWYLMAWRKYAEFDGRSRRTEYWMFALFNFLILIALGVLGGVGVAISQDTGGILFIPLVIYFLAILIPSLAVGVRRLHDTGKSGWLLLLFMVLGFIPIVGFIASIVQIVILCQDSDPGMNEYGPSPKYPELAGMAAGYTGFTPMGLGAQPQPFMDMSAARNVGYCGNCGTALPAGSRFCSSCGAHI